MFVLQMLRDLISPRQVELLASDGWVGCPNAAHDASLDTCLSCERLIETRVDEDNQTWVRCRP